jgi:hypothetical protein
MLLIFLKFFLDLFFRIKKEKNLIAEETNVLGCLAVLLSMMSFIYFLLAFSLFLFKLHVLQSSTATRLN